MCSRFQSFRACKEKKKKASPPTLVLELFAFLFWFAHSSTIQQRSTITIKRKVKENLSVPSNSVLPSPSLVNRIAINRNENGHPTHGISCAYRSRVFVFAYQRGYQQCVRVCSTTYQQCGGHISVTVHFHPIRLATRRRRDAGGAADPRIPATKEKETTKKKTTMPTQGRRRR